MKSPNKSYVGRRPDVSALVPKDAHRILDAGCSNGTLGQQLLNDNPERIVTGIEYDRNLAAKASENLQHVYIADLNNFSWNENFDAALFDCIIFSDVLEHLIDPWTVLTNACKHLSKDGTIIISIPNIRHVSALHSIFIKGTFPIRNRGIFDKTHMRWFTYSDLIALCLHAGLTVQVVSANLRLLDSPGGKINNKFEKWMKPLSNFRLVNNFFAYQYIVRTKIKGTT